MDMHTRLKEARIRAGYKSGAAAARRLGLAASTYNAHENGQNEFGPDHAEAYGRAFKVSAGWLLTGNGSIEPTSSTAYPDPEIDDLSEGTKAHSPISNKARIKSLLQPDQIPLYGDLDGFGDYIAAPQNHIDMIEGPRHLVETLGAYALRMPGTSMEPRYHEGETLFVVPRTARPGQYVVVQYLQETDEFEQAIWQVARYEKVTGANRVFSRYNGPDLVIPNEKIRAIHEIIATGGW